MNLFIIPFPVAIQEEKKKRMGPGGLDPVEVFESLPKVRASHYTRKKDIFCQS